MTNQEDVPCETKLLLANERITTLLARNEELERALRERSERLHMQCREHGGFAGESERHQGTWEDCQSSPCVSDRTLINGEEK